MEPSAVVYLVDEARKVLGDIGEGLELHWVDAFDFKRLHEAFRLGVIVGVSAPSHGADEALVRERIPIGPGRVLGRFKRSTQQGLFLASLASDEGNRAVVCGPRWRR